MNSRHAAARRAGALYFLFDPWLRPGVGVGGRPNPAGSLLGALLILALLLAVWIRVSMVVVALFFDGPPPQAGHLLRDVLASPNGWAFLATYMAAGFGFAVLVFSASVVSLPLLLDRPRADTMTAIVTSMRVLGANRGPMLLWAGLIVALTAIGFATGYVGLVVLLPIVGHATWHAYRELVEPAMESA